MPKFSLFRKPKNEEEPEKTAVTSQEPQAPAPSPQEPEKGTVEFASSQEALKQEVENSKEQKQEVTVAPNKTYLKAMPLRDLSDVEKVKAEVRNGNIIILRVTPLAGKSIEDVKSAVNELYEFTEATGGDIARLGEERVVVCPKNIRIWREKTPAPVSNEPLPTAA